MCVEHARGVYYFHITDMVIHLRIALVTCLLLFILMEDAKPVLARTGKQRINKLEARVKVLEENMAEEGKCKGKLNKLRRENISLRLPCF